jgi:hypothetical protein
MVVWVTFLPSSIYYTINTIRCQARVSHSFRTKSPPVRKPAKRKLEELKDRGYPNNKSSERENTRRIKSIWGANYSS